MKRLYLLIGLICLWPINSHAVLPASLASSDTSAYISNTVIEIVEHNGEIWLATSRGANVSSDSGVTWFLIDDAPGMVSINVSALHSQSNRVWMSTNHQERIGDATVSISDAIMYFDDDGASWTMIDFSEDGLNIPNLGRAFQTIFDITGYNDQLSGDDWLFSAAYAGGLIASRDNGSTWRRIYFSAGDSLQYNDPNQAPSFRNRYFSAVADSSHNDTIMLWTGTAGGIVQYIYVPPSEKLYATEVKAITGCDLCPDSASNYLYFGTDIGVSRVLRTGGLFETRDTTTGPITALYNFQDMLFAGTADSVLVDATKLLASTGLTISTDQGETFSSAGISGLDGVVGVDKKILSFMSVGERLLMAAETAGLYVTHNAGSTWDRILIDANDLASPLNSAYDLDMIIDTMGDTLLFIGTDSGVVRLQLAPDDSIMSQINYEYAENETSSQGIRAVEVHQYLDNLGSVDSTVIWTINVPPVWVGEGTFSVIRGTLVDDTNILRASYLLQKKSHDIGFIGDTLYVVGDYGVMANSEPNNDTIVDGPVIQTALIDNATTVYLLSDTVYVMENLDGQGVFGSSSSVAVQKGSTHDYRITMGNIDSLGRDVAINYTFSNTDFVENNVTIIGLSGDFVPAMAVQYMSSGPARVWASCRPTSESNAFNGISVGIYNDDQFRWHSVYSDAFAWNFAFDGDFVTYAATNAGLLKNEHTGDTSSVWDTVSIISETGIEILGATTPVYSVLVKDDNLWIGTEEGTIRQSLTDESDHELFIVVDTITPEDEVYAYPVPFSPGQGEELHFRFVVDAIAGANVTIEIYDFAMSLVARPIDGIHLPQGHYENPDSDRLTWDGYNGRGDLVAVGVYYFKIIYSTGEERWGKLAVMP